MLQCMPEIRIVDGVGTISMRAALAMMSMLVFLVVAAAARVMESCVVVWGRGGGRGGD